VSRVTFLLEAVAVSNPQTIANSSSPRSEVEVLLLEHPDVIDASLINEEGPDGKSYPVAYVVPHAERMKEAKTRIYLTDRDKRVAQWRKAFDQVYRQGSGDHAPTFVGWTSSYTNKPLPETEMREWLDCTIQRIMSFKPEKVLEIGCGVGLLVRELAPSCSVYRGTDLSMVAVGRLREFVASKPELRHVELCEREATNLDDQAPGSVDTVVINSVVQYFPDIHYLRTVIDGAARVVSSGGRIFIGDVRHLGLLPLFHGAVQFAKAPPSASARWLKRKVLLAVEQDRELVIDPQFFLELTHSIPRISGVEILLKRGQAHNELTRYRYDVVLHVGETRSIPSRREAEWRDVSNRRLASDIASVRRLWSADDRQLVGDIRRSLAAEIESGSDPEDFWKLSDTQPRRRLATDPLEVAFMQQLGLELRQLLSDRLPESRLPAAVLAVNELPSGEAATVPDSAVHFRQAAARQMVEG
jgi:SAM-dependent methyltransferase